MEDFKNPANGLQCNSKIVKKKKKKKKITLKFVDHDCGQKD